MQKQTTYVTLDGSVFDSQRAARAHSVKLAPEILTDILVGAINRTEDLNDLPIKTEQIAAISETICREVAGDMMGFVSVLADAKHGKIGTVILNPAVEPEEMSE